MLLVVLVTIPQNKARFLAKKLLQKKVCACINIIKGIESFFWWEGKIDITGESLMIIKTKKSLFSKLKKVIKENHPYTVPEIVGIEATKVNKPYLDWINKETCD
tara:strand:+ start:434 stop:745 length:312 start_codon:yes stop_codon:yes gene_type:complete